MTIVERMEAFAVRVPLSAPVKMAGVTLTFAENVIVRVIAKDGNVGWGEATSAPLMTGELPAGMVAAARFLAPRVEGRSFASPEEIGPILDAALYGNQGPKSAVEMALLDLIGKTSGRPIYELLGGRVRDKGTALIMIAGGTIDEEVANAKAAAGRGFVSFKVKVGVGTPDADLERCRRVRAALGPDVQISADANQGYAPESALAFARGAGEAGLDFFEQPVMGHDLETMAACARVASIPIGADEGFHHFQDIDRHHELGAAAGGSLKTIKLGGLIPVMAAGHRMDELGMSVNLAGKTAETSIASAAIAHLAVALPRLDWGTSMTNQYLADDVTDTPVLIENGMITPPDGPGLGVRPNPDKLSQYRLDI